jgi:hypothetical protein
MENRQQDALFGRSRRTFGHSLGHGAFRTESAVPNLLAEQVKDPEVPSSSETPTADVFTALRKQYLAAVRRNTAAKTGHTLVLNPKQQQSSEPRNVPQTANILSTRLVQVSRQKQHAHLDIIQHHADELKQLSSDQINLSSHVANDEEHTSASASGSEISQMIEDVQTTLRSLETAVVRVRHSADRETARLQATRSSIDSSPQRSVNGQLQALNVVRKQLTAWLEDSLAVCSSEDMLNGTRQASKEKGVVTTAMVQEAYDGYFGIRIELLGAVQSMSISALPLHDIDQETEILPRAPSASVEDHVIDSEQTLRARQAEESLQQLNSYLNSSQADEEASAVESLHRLADESHLLPAYPILAQSEKFSNAMKAFGSTEAKQPADRVMEQTNAWRFAAEAANDATTSQLEVSLRRGHEAIDAVKNNMEDISFLSKAWSRFGKTH